MKILKKLLIADEISILMIAFGLFIGLFFSLMSITIESPFIGPELKKYLSIPKGSTILEVKRVIGEPFSIINAGFEGDKILKYEPSPFLKKVSIYYHFKGNKLYHIELRVVGSN